MYALRYFPSAQEAKTYRHEHGTGGWIFEPEGDGDSILFPPHFSPSMIFKHSATKGKTGYLRGTQ